MSGAGSEKAGGAEDDGKERDSSQSWDGSLVDLPGIGRIEEPFAQRDNQNVRNDDPSENDCSNEGCNY